MRPEDARCDDHTGMDYPPRCYACDAEIREALAEAERAEDEALAKRETTAWSLR